MNERTRMILFVAIAAMILFTYQPIMRRLGFMTEPTPIASTQPTTQSTSGPAVSWSATTPSFTTGTAQSSGSTGALMMLKPASATTSPVTLGSAIAMDPGYALQLTVDPVSGGLSQVVLNDFRQSLDKDTRFTFETSYGSGDTAPLATRSLTIGGTTHPIPQEAWQVQQSERAVRLTADIADKATGKPLVRIEKTYEVRPRSEGGDEGPKGFEIKFNQKLTNLSGGNLDINSTIAGPTFPPSEQARGGDRQLIAGYQGSNTVNLYHEATEAFGPDMLSKEYTKNKNGEPLLWIGAGGNYFNGIVRPTDAESWIKTAKAEAFNPNVADAHKRQVLITLETTNPGALAPGASREINAEVFFGPRLRSLLGNAHYAAGRLQYYHTLEISGSCAMCTVSWLVNLLMSLLSFFHGVLGDWGLAIILLVLVVRAILHPITKKSQVNMAKMSKMGPEIERIKKKYGDDKEGMNRAMLEFYKNHGATPILGCIPMFLQMPIWIALYSGLSTTFELRHEPFFYGLTWIKDLSKPDHLIALDPANHIHLLFLYIDGLNIIPLLLAVAFFFQFKLQPKPPTMTPEQQQQQTMMKWMTTFLFPLMLYPMPSGLTIYILTSTVFGIIESKIVRRHIDQQEALKAAGPQIVEGDVVETPRSTFGKKAAEKTGGIIGWFQKLQERAEALRQDAEKKAQKKKK